MNRAAGALIGLALATAPANAAVLDQTDAARLAAVNDALQAFENDVGAALHNLPPEAAGEVESYAYVELNLEAAHERLNTVFMLVAVSVFMDTPADQSLVLETMYRQVLPPSRTYLLIKADAIASLVTAHPDHAAFAAYRRRAEDLLARRAVPLLDDLYRRIGAAPR